ncbi:MAG: methylated-DNA--[protein]-cysteine S-methyltransferase [Pirellulales bacterium]
MSARRLLFVAAFDTDLGWLALVGAAARVQQVTFPRKSRKAAIAEIDLPASANARECDWNPALVRRLQEFAAGAPDDFRDVELDLDDLTPLQRRIIKACRAIGYGQSASYGEVAAAAGNARAARAVGNTMAANRFALLVPCHRVVHRGGDVGRLSGPARLRLALRRLESQDLAVGDRHPPRRRRATTPR